MNVIDKYCSFFGHRKIDITEELKINIKNTIINLIENEKVFNFYFGGFGDFDDLCWQIVSKLKIKYPFIKRIFCLFDPRHLRASKQPKWLNHNDFEDWVYLNLTFDYWYTRIYYRNCKIVDNSTFIIFYIKSRNNSGAYKTYQYAKIKKKTIILI